MEFDEGASVDGGNVSDIRGGGGGGFPGGRLVAGGGGAIGLIGLVIALLLGGNPLGGGGGGFGVSDPSLEASSPPAASDLNGQSCKAGTGPQGRSDVFATCAFNDVQRTWATIFAGGGQSYQPTTLVLYTGQTQTRCGVGSSAAGPFYCPADRRVYLDLSFFDELRRDLGSPGDFAQAYVVAHEVAHHVQQLLGTSDQVAAATRKKPSREKELSVRTELQADCYAGVWANTAQRAGSIRLDATDPEEAIRAAGQIGDDRLQKAAGRPVNPESFTHGSAAQRTKWLRQGLEKGDPSSCDTFSGGI
ncbi:MAG: neutral zinc metallopeptidase [Acidimicrobiales bacterium]